MGKITAHTAVGRRVVNILVKVWLKSGEEVWAIVHVEMQSRNTGSKYRDDAKMGEYVEVRNPLPSVIPGAGENGSMRESGARIPLLR